MKEDARAFGTIGDYCPRASVESDDYEGDDNSTSDEELFAVTLNTLPPRIYADRLTSPY